MATSNVCMNCFNKYRLHERHDPTMSILYNWTLENDKAIQLPKEVNCNVIVQSLIIQNVDNFLNNHMRKKFSENFPLIIDINGSEKSYFLQSLEEDPALANFFLLDINDGKIRRNIALKLWIGGTVAAKGTRQMYNVQGRQERYNPEHRENDFKAAEELAALDTTCNAGVEVAVILELLIRKIPLIFLDRLNPNSNSPILRYIKDKEKKEVSVPDLILI